jgi:hypothetical protein
MGLRATLFTKMLIKMTAVITEVYPCYLHRKCYPTLSSYTPYAYKLIGNHQCGFCLGDQPLMRYLRKNGSTVRQYISCLCTTEFSIPMKLVRLIKMSLNSTYCEVSIHNHLFKYFLFRMIWNKEMLYHHRFLTLC